MQRIGLTGGIGSGKSTVAAMLAELGASIIDADAISRQLTAAGGAAMPAIASAFGAGFVNASGALDREVMRKQVFSDPGSKRRLEAIIHPLVASQTAAQALTAERAGAPCVVFDVPLLVESGHWRPRLHQVLVIDCTESRQISRVMQRSAWTPEAVQQVMAGQADRAQRLAAADLCIYNETVSLVELAALVRAVALRFGL
jgi:dephospho-CoA kinase